MRPWSQPALVGNYIKRYNRFFVDVEIDGKVVVAHCANTGSLKGVIESAEKALVTRVDNPERKLQYSLQALSAPNGSWIGVNTANPNQLIADAFDQNLFTDWSSFVDFQSEVKIDANTRLDACLIDTEGQRRFVEVKNVTMKNEEHAQFPDSVTERGLKHLEALIDLVRSGFQAECLFAVQRTDCQYFSSAEVIDPRYSEGLRRAHQEGVSISARVLKVTEAGLKWQSGSINIVL